MDGRECWQRGIGLSPLPVAQFDGHPRKATNLLEVPLLLRGGQSPGLAAVGSCVGLESFKA
jgi:hypothetical protein